MKQNINLVYNKGYGDKPHIKPSIANGIKWKKRELLKGRV